MCKLANSLIEIFRQLLCLHAFFFMHREMENGYVMVETTWEDRPDHNRHLKANGILVPPETVPSALYNCLLVHTFCSLKIARDVNFHSMTRFSVKFTNSGVQAMALGHLWYTEYCKTICERKKINTQQLVSQFHLFPPLPRAREFRNN